MTLPDDMQAMVLTAPGRPLQPRRLPLRLPAAGEVLIDVHACAVCRTDLHVVDGELPEPKLPLVPGHEIVGTVAALGPGVDRFALGARVGVPWLGYTCGACDFCRNAARISASRRASPATRSMVAMPPTRWRMRATVSRFRMRTATPKRRR